MLEAYSNKVSEIDIDVTDDTSVAAAFARILAQGPVNVLIEMQLEGVLRMG
jgi:hypothetical protein